MNSENLSKTRYGDIELLEFKELIMKKMDSAKSELNYLQEQISNTAGNDTNDTTNKFQGIEDGVDSMEKEYLTQMASRQIQFIKHLDNALIRIENKTYGICRETGKLISRERLKAVPHATLSIEAKNAKNK